MDNLNDLQDTLLALAAYDWFKFNDSRIFRLKADYNIIDKNQDIFNYYMGKNPQYIELNRDRYIRKHKIYLSAMIYA